MTFHEAHLHAGYDAQVACFRADNQGYFLPICIFQARNAYLSNSPECRNLSKKTIFSHSASTLSTSTNLSAQALAWGSRLRDHRPPQHKANLTSQLLRATFLPDSLPQSALWTTSSMHVQRFNLSLHFIYCYYKDISYTIYQTIIMLS